MTTTYTPFIEVNLNRDIGKTPVITVTLLFGPKLPAVDLYESRGITTLKHARGVAREYAKALKIEWEDCS